MKTHEELRAAWAAARRKRSKETLERYERYGIVLCVGTWSREYTIVVSDETLAAIEELVRADLVGQIQE